MHKKDIIEHYELNFVTHILPFRNDYHFIIIFLYIFCNLIRVILALKEEERIMKDRLHVFELDPTQGISVRPRRQKYVRNDRAIKDLVEAFDQVVNPENERIRTHLRAIQHRLGLNDFDEWDN